MMNSVILLIAFTLVVFVVSKGALDSDKIGPYDVIFKFIEPCPADPQYGLKFDIQSRRISKNKFALSCVSVFPYPLDSSISVQLSFNRFGNGGWKPNFYNIKLNDMCNTLKGVNPKFFANLTKQSKVPHKCPIKKANLTVKDFEINFEDVSNNHIVMFYFGQYRVDMKAIKNKHVILCYHLFVDLIPKS